MITTGFYIEVSNGLLIGHRKRMGVAVWEFMWILDKVTKIDDEGVGWVLGGKPIKLKEISEDLETGEGHISENLTKLEKQGYILKKRAPQGLIIKVAKAKKRFSQKAKSDFTKRRNQTSKKAKSNKTRQYRQDSKTIINNTNEHGSSDINNISRYFLKAMQIPKEDCTQKQSRRYWQLLLKESKSGLGGVKWLIDIASSDEFFKNNLSSSKDLYYKRIKLIQRRRGEKPKIAVMT